MCKATSEKSKCEKAQVILKERSSFRRPYSSVSRSIDPRVRDFQIVDYIVPEFQIVEYTVTEFQIVDYTVNQFQTVDSAVHDFQIVDYTVALF